MFTQTDYGYFSIWHPEADLWLYDLQKGTRVPCTRSTARSLRVSIIGMPTVTGSSSPVAGTMDSTPASISRPSAMTDAPPSPSCCHSAILRSTTVSYSTLIIPPDFSKREIKMGLEVKD